jgi:hypothetical protein
LCALRDKGFEHIAWNQRSLGEWQFLSNLTDEQWERLPNAAAVVAAARRIEENLALPFGSSARNGAFTIIHGFVILS